VSEDRTLLIELLPLPLFSLVSLGQPFQSPFAKPPGQGLSTSTVNAVWGFFNLVVGYVLVCKVGVFDLRNTDQVLSLGLGILLMSILMARMFGRFHGGNVPETKSDY
jgi:hypothetical protein